MQVFSNPNLPFGRGGGERGGKYLAPKKWRENFGAKKMAGKFWQDDFGGKKWGRGGQTLWQLKQAQAKLIPSSTAIMFSSWQDKHPDTKLFPNTETRLTMMKTKMR
jgi:hypothetical protein